MRRATVYYLVLLLFCAVSCTRRHPSNCFIGAFLGDAPSVKELKAFESAYGKKAFMIMVYVDWESSVDPGVLHGIYDNGSVVCVTWEPWYAAQKRSIDFSRLLSGEYDAYIDSFARQLASVEKTIFLRFAHEMNGDWYPWSGIKIGSETYKAAYRYVKDRFDRIGMTGVRWIFSINAENVPPDNAYQDCYPGDAYVDYIGIDGYNWGTTKAWSTWKDFQNIFLPLYNQLIKHYNKEIIITEFGSTSKGGDKARWITDALRDLKKMERIQGFVLFNVDKETDWRFPPEEASGQALRDGLKDPFFVGSANHKNKYDR